MDVQELVRKQEIKEKNLQDCEDLMLKDGYVVFKNAIPLELSLQIKKNIHDTLVILGASAGDSFEKQYDTVIQKIPPFDVNIELRRHFTFSKFPQKLLLISDISNMLFRLLGPDLAFLEDAELPVNIKGRTEYYLSKKFHQEFWSGAGYRTYILWTPFIFPSGSGGLEVIKGSHLWGHVPHRNREPLHIPENAERVIIDTAEYSDRDIVLFHSLTLHRSIPNTIDSPRLAYATHVRNIFENDTGFETLKNWEIFHLSVTSQIMKACGNPHLSPFRTLPN